MDWLVQVYHGQFDDILASYTSDDELVILSEDRQRVTMFNAKTMEERVLLERRYYMEVRFNNVPRADTYYIRRTPETIALICHRTSECFLLSTEPGSTVLTPVPDINTLAFQGPTNSVVSRILSTDKFDPIKYTTWFGKDENHIFGLPQPKDTYVVMQHVRSLKIYKLDFIFKSPLFQYWRKQAIECLAVTKDGKIVAATKNLVLEFDHDGRILNTIECINMFFTFEDGQPNAGINMRDICIGKGDKIYILDKYIGVYCTTIVQFTPSVAKKLPVEIFAPLKAFFMTMILQKTLPKEIVLYICNFICSGFTAFNSITCNKVEL